MSHEFESAILKVGTTLKGALCDATVNVVALNPRKATAGGRTYAHANSNPRTFLLSPGEYEVEIRGVRLEGDPREKFTIILKAGDEVERIIKW